MGQRVAYPPVYARKPPKIALSAERKKPRPLKSQLHVSA